MSDDGPRFRAAEEHVAEAPLPHSRRIAAPSTGPEAEPSPHAHKFRAVAAGLIAIAVASIVVAISLSAFGGSSAKSSGGTWSAFTPQDSGLQGAQEIADFVSPYYRATPAYQLAVVTAMNLNDPSNPLEVVVPSTSAPGGVAALPAKSTIAYNLCGLGSRDCSIGVGSASSDRLLLLRREALELALYTFKYIPGVHTVVAILPPGQTQSSSRLSAKPPTGSQVSSNNTKSVDLALAFDQKELQPWLDRPLRETLPEPLPPTVQQMANAPEAELVSVITAHGLFSEHTEQAQDGSNLLVLSPQSPQ
jgi:hypothetical protein